MARLLIFSASMGGGHDGAARELARRAGLQGHQAEVVDFLDAFPRPLARLWQWFYVTQLRRWPESYESSYQLFYKYPALWGPFVRFERALAGRRCLRWVARYEPDIVVSTYSFASLVVGRLVEEGALKMPTVAFLTDFGVHPRTVHPAIGLHVAVHPIAAEETRRYVPGAVVASGPAVHPAFGADRMDRADARAALGLTLDRPVVLVVCGSWGIGPRLEQVVQSLVSVGRYQVVTVCGRDDVLRARLDAAGLGRVYGWTDQMPALMAAADVVVENAGGLSSLEAFSAGVPVVSFDPIPGHGRDNVATMARAGVTMAPADFDGLRRAVEVLSADTPERTEQLAAVEKMFAGDPIDDILDLLYVAQAR